MSWLSSSWRNPFLSLSDSQRETLAARFRAWSEAQPWLIDAAKRELGCAELDSASLETCHGEVIRDWLLDPARRWIMVFGSNEAGRHGKGAALVAHHRFEAAMGVGQGLTGNAWALPTKDATLKTLPLGRIQEEAQELLHYARLAPNFHFMLSRVGCGLARYTDEQIAPSSPMRQRISTYPVDGSNSFAQSPCPVLWSTAVGGSQTRFCPPCLTGLVRSWGSMCWSPVGLVGRIPLARAMP